MVCDIHSIGPTQITALATAQPGLASTDESMGASRPPSPEPPPVPPLPPLPPADPLESKLHPPASWAHSAKAAQAARIGATIPATAAGSLLAGTGVGSRRRGLGWLLLGRRRGWRPQLLAQLAHQRLQHRLLLVPRQIRRRKLQPYGRAPIRVGDADELERGVMRLLVLDQREAHEAGLLVLLGHLPAAIDPHEPQRARPHRVERIGHDLLHPRSRGRRKHRKHPRREQGRAPRPHSFSTRTMRLRCRFAAEIAAPDSPRPTRRFSQVRTGILVCVGPLGSFHAAASSGSARSAAACEARTTLPNATCEDRRHRQPTPRYHTSCTPWSTRI